MRTFSLFLLLPLFLLSLGCQIVGRDYQSPQVALPANYKKETNRALGFRQNWWTAFADPTLNSLQRSLRTANLDLRAALARRDQAIGALGISRAAQLPQVGASAEASRQRSSENGITGNFGPTYFNLYSVTGTLQYEVDLWGKVRREVEASRAEAQAAEATLADVRVALETQLARSYFALRFLDQESAILKKAVSSREETLDLAQTRAEGGLTSALDASRASGELASARAALYSLIGPRAQLENAVAVLVGKNASQFRLPPLDYEGTLPRVGAGLPSNLLSRRPDVAAAERTLAAASARNGVAEGEFFPTLRLTGAGGFSSINTSDFLKKSSGVLSIGPSLNVPLFQGGRLRSQLKVAQAQQRESLARFQQTTLNAFAEVESALALVHGLKKELAAREQTVTSTLDAFELSQTRYTEGVDSYLGVIDSQRALLSARRARTQTRGQQFSAALQLIQALGGSYSP